MLRWTLLFLALALVAAVLGFSPMAGALAGVAQILFLLFLVLFLGSLLLGASAHRIGPPPPPF